MGRLLNVRLSEEEAAMVDQLRRQGITVSEVVRAALRSACSSGKEQAPSASSELLEWLHRKYPAPAGRARRRPDTTDRREVASFLSRLRKRGIRRDGE